MPVPTGGTNIIAEIQPPLHAGVNFPPPFVYVAAFVAGLLLQREWPLPITGPTQETVRGAILGSAVG